MPGTADCGMNGLKHSHFGLHPSRRPHFGECNGGDEKVGRVLSVMPCDQAGIGSRFLRLAHGVRVEHEVHRRTGLTRSSGMRGGCQSVVKRTESCHALSFCMERRAVVLRRNLRDGCFREVPFACRAASQPNSSRAWRAESFLTFLTASSTVLMGNRLARRSAWSKRVLCSSDGPQRWKRRIEGLIPNAKGRLQDWLRRFLSKMDPHPALIRSDYRSASASAPQASREL